MKQLIDSILAEKEPESIEKEQGDFLSKSKAEIEQILTDRFGRFYAVSLAEKFDVAPSTVYRVFKRDKLKMIYKLAIAQILQAEIKK